MCISWTCNICWPVLGLVEWPHLYLPVILLATCAEVDAVFFLFCLLLSWYLLMSWSKLCCLYWVILIVHFFYQCNPVVFVLCHVAVIGPILYIVISIENTMQSWTRLVVCESRFTLNFKTGVWGEVVGAQWNCGYFQKD